MKSSNALVAMLSIMMVVAMITVPSSYAQLEPITVTTDKESYAAGETVTVNGEVRRSLQGAITVQVLAPNNNRVAIDQLTPGDDGAFSTTFVAAGFDWRAAGTYTIQVTYGAVASNIVTATTTIEFTGGTATPPPTPTPEPVDPLAGITSSITGGTITSISQGAGPTIIVVIESTDDGELTLNIPRSILDARTDGQTGDDIPFIILVDNSEADITETQDANVRTLVIPFTVGTEVIEVVGSWIIPEFGVIAIAILAVAIVAIIAVSSRSSVSILPRY